jgi:putative ABC transport system permease protein
MGVVNGLDDLRSDVRYAARTLRRSPGFAVVAIVTLALGIGANTAIFSVVNAVLLRSLPYKDADGLYRIFGSVPPTDNPNGPARRVPGVQVADLAPLRAQTKTLSHVAFYLPLQVTRTGRDDVARIEGARMTADALSMLGAQPILGRSFEPREEVSGADTVAILSYALWQRSFGGTPDALGQNLTLDGRTYSIIGVMPQGFQFPDTQTRFWIPFVATDFPLMGGSPLVRLKPGITPEAAAAEVTSLLPQIRASRPAAPGPFGAGPPPPPTYELVGMQDLMVAPVRPALLVLTVAVGLVLLIACVNVANLLLARTTSRQREIAIRLAIGAGRARLLRQALTESVLLAVGGGAAGMALAYGGIHLLQALAAGAPRRDIGPGFTLPRIDEIGLDWRVLAFTLAMSIITGLLFGLAPAIRRAQPTPMDALREGAGASSSGFSLLRRNRTQGLLVVSEIAMAVMLFIGGALLIRCVVNLANVDPGYEAAHVMTAQVSLPRGRYSAGPQFTAFTEELTTRLQRLNGVRGVGYARQLPTVRMRQLTLLRFTPEMPARPPAPPPFDGRQRTEEPDTRLVSREFLKVMGVRLIAGRMFDAQDAAGRPQVMLINQTLATSGFLGENPIGRQVYALGRAPWEVVGVVSDVRQFDLDQDPDPQIFIDYRQDPPPRVPLPPFAGPAPAPYFAVRTADDPLAVAASMRGIVRELEPQATLDNIASMEQLVSNSFARPRLYAVLLGVFAGVAVALTAIGIYGVMAYSVAQRIREIGIRMALGAQRGDVMGLVLGQSLVLTALGIAAGIAGAFAVTRYLQQMLFGLTPLDPATFVAVAAAFGVIATLAAFVPARRATRVDPLVALRCE